MNKKPIAQIAQIIWGAGVAVFIPPICVGFFYPRGFFLFTSIGSTISLIGFIVAGLPSYIVFQWRKIYSFEAYFLAGIIEGALIGGLFALAAGSRDYSHPLAPFFLFGIFCGFGGASTASIFWSIVRPDKKAIKSP